MIAGIDPSLSRTGVVVIDADGKVKRDLVLTSDPKDNLIDRICRIGDDANLFLWDCRLVVIEEVPYKAKGRIVDLAELVGALIYIFAKTDRAVILVHPLTAAKAVLGRAPMNKKERHELARKVLKTDLKGDLLDAYILALYGLKHWRKKNDNMRRHNKNTQDL